MVKKKEYNAKEELIAAALLWYDERARGRASDTTNEDLEMAIFHYIHRDVIL